MNTEPEQYITYAHDHSKEFLQGLMDFIKIPSISTSPESKEDVLSAANWLAKRLTNLGINNVKVISVIKRTGDIDHPFGK